MGIEVQLTDGDLMLARQIALMRTGMNRANDVQKSNFGRSKEWENEINGVLGEIAFGKHFNLYLDLTFNIRKGGSDFTTRKGETVDIKTTDLKDGRLVVPHWKNHPSKRCDVYVLITGTFPTLTIQGYATAKLVFDNEINLGHGPCYGLTQQQLTKFK